MSVLWDFGTASCGEHPRWVLFLFGAPTAGVPTANTAKMLSDGAYINLTTALDCDRTGQIYQAPIPPDEAVTMDWSLLSTDRDPVITAASDWLRRQPAFAT